MAAASKDQSVKKWLENVLKRTEEDIALMESDLSRLGEYESYE